MLLRSNTLAAICLLGKAHREIHRWIYLHLQCTSDSYLVLSLLYHLACTVLSWLIIFPQWLQWCVLSPKGQHILLIDLSHAAEREWHRESSFNCGFRGLFPMWWCHCVSKPSPEGACTRNEGLSIVPAHIFLLSLDPVLTVLPSSLAFIFSHLVQALSQHFPWVCPSSALWFYPFHLSFSYNVTFLCCLSISVFLKSL